MERKNYLSLFRRTYKSIPQSQSKKAKELIERAADIAVILDECKEHLTSEGLVTKMPQGEYEIERENPYSKIFDAKMKAYLAVIQALDKLMPDTKTEGVTKAGEALAAFVAKGKG